MSTTRYGPGGSDAPNSAVAPENDKYASSVPLSTSGSMPSTLMTPPTNSAAFAASRVALVATIRTASAERSPMILAYPLSAPSVRSSASGASRPVESTPWPSRTICIRRSTSVSRPVPGSTSATSRRSELVPQSMAATRAGAPSRLTGRSRTHGPLRPPFTGRVRPFPAQRVGAGRRELVRDEGVQALHPVRHAARALHAGRERVHPRRGRCGVPPGHVVTVRGLLRSAQVRVGGQPLLHIPHQAARFQPAHRGGRQRAGEVEEGGKRRAVVQPRCGHHHVGLPARAAVRHPQQSAGRPAKLLPDRPPPRHACGLPWSAWRTECHSRSYQGVAAAALKVELPPDGRPPMIT